jgi:lipoate-protein ligase A
MNDALIVPSRVAAHAGFERAAAASRGRGWPVLVRSSGGAPVAQFPGMLNIALAYRIDPGSRWSIDEAYRHLADLLAGALARLGLAAATGEIADAFCPGRYDLALGGRKVAGLAQRRKRATGGGQAILVHACLLVEGDLNQPFDALAAFEDTFLPERRWRPGAATSLAAHLGRADVLDGVAAALGDALRTAPLPG